MTKSEIREEILRRKQQYSRQQRDELSSPIMDKLLAHPRIAEAQTILMYYSLPDEVNTHQTVDQLLGMGKRVLLPVVVDAENLEIRCYESNNDLREGAFHIMEPIGRPFTDFASLEIGVIPGMGFDAQGHRLGRGKGYYDRLLAQLPHMYKLGVCFDFQKVEQIPVTQFDITMDEIL